MQLTNNEAQNESRRVQPDKLIPNKLLETEILLKEKQTAAGKTKDEAVMLLNHKEAIDFIVAFPDYMEALNTRK